MQRGDAPDRNADDMFQRERIRYQWMLESVQKFKFFFAGLVFAILSFSVQFSITPANCTIKWSQATGWACLLITGVLALKDTGGFVKIYNEKSFDGLGSNWRVLMWVLFVAAMFLLIITRIIPNNAT